MYTGSKGRHFLLDLIELKLQGVDDEQAVDILFERMKQRSDSRWASTAGDYYTVLGSKSKWRRSS